MDEWCDENSEIRQFTTALNIPTITVAYDIVAARPELELPAIFKFFGSSYEPSVLRYWKSIIMAMQRTARAALL